jgi:hypothetical protein
MGKRRIITAVSIAAAIAVGIWVGMYRSEVPRSGTVDQSTPLRSRPIERSTAGVRVDPQAPLAPPEPSDRSPVSNPEIIGEVTADTGPPIAGAEVYAIQPGIDWCPNSQVTSAKSAANGLYRLVLKPDQGAFDLIAVASGHVPRVVLSNCTLTPSERRTQNITLTRGANICGTVTDEWGRPVVGAEVLALGLEADPPRINTMHRLGSAGLRCTYGRARTDDAGRYDVSGLVGGRSYMVYARSRSMYVSYDIVGGSKTVSAGTAGVDFVLEAAHCVTFRFLDARTQTPIPDVRVEFLGQGMGSLFPEEVGELYADQESAAALRRKGQFVLRARVTPEARKPSAPRKLTVYVTALGYERRTLHFDFDVVPTSLEREEIVKLQPVASTFGGVRLTLQPSAPSVAVDGPVPVRVASDGGTWIEYPDVIPLGRVIEFSHVPAGPLRLECLVGSGMWATYPGFTYAFEPLDVVVPANGMVELAVTAKPLIDRGSVRIVAADENGSPLDFVSLSVAGGNRYSYFPACRFPGTARNLELPAGTYKVTGSKFGYRDDEKSFVVNTGEPREVALVLTREDK